MEVTLKIGKHDVSAEDDLLVIRWVGSPTVDDFQGLLALVERQAEKHGAVYILGDMTQAKSPDAAGRKVMSDWDGHHKMVAMANFGDSLPTRVIASLIIRGLQLLGKQPPNAGFFREEAAARAWLTAQRKKRQQF